MNTAKELPHIATIKIMKSLLLPVAISALLHSCAPPKPLVMDAYLVPTAGRLADKKVTSLPVQFTYNGSGSGDVKVTMPDGEVCIGRYTTSAGGMNYSQSGSSNFTIREETYGYGEGSTYTGTDRYAGRSSIRENQQVGRAIATGNKGTVINFSYITSMSNPTHGEGTGFDNRGNKYNMIY